MVRNDMKLWPRQNENNLCVYKLSHIVHIDKYNVTHKYKLLS